jgi:hypothetical protein
MELSQVAESFHSSMGGIISPTLTQLGLSFDIAMISVHACMFYCFFELLKLCLFHLLHPNNSRSKLCIFLEIFATLLHFPYLFIYFFLSKLLFDNAHVRHFISLLFTRANCCIC